MNFVLIYHETTCGYKKFLFYLEINHWTFISVEKAPTWYNEEDKDVETKGLHRPDNPTSCLHLFLAGWPWVIHFMFLRLCSSYRKWQYEGLLTEML